MPRIATLSLLALLAGPALLVSPASAGKVYKCTSAEGKTYYSGQPCPESAASETLRVPAPAGKEAPPGKSDTGKTLDEQIAEAEDPVRKAQLQLRKQECELVKTQLERYEGAPYLVERQEDGTQRRLSDEEAAAEKQRLRDKLEAQCQ